MIWLLRHLKPHFKTIADFRRDNRAAFRPGEWNRVGGGHRHKPMLPRLSRLDGAIPDDRGTPNSVPLPHIQALLGHASLATTERYTHVAITRLQEVHARTHPAARVSIARTPLPDEESV